MSDVHQRASRVDEHHHEQYGIRSIAAVVACLCCWRKKEQDTDTQDQLPDLDPTSSASVSRSSSCSTLLSFRHSKKIVLQDIILLEHIFSFLDTVSLFQASLVCKQWARVRWLNLNLTEYNYFMWSDLKLLLLTKKPHRIDVSGCVACGAHLVDAILPLVLPCNFT
eukprot:m.67893 g.67893  ORF g.67893 m.67893 type:complete len:166 (+) comp8230_c0_seq6:229-726(+)